MDKEAVKRRIIEDVLQTKEPLSISCLQRKYRIGFVFAKEIYEECLTIKTNDKYN